MESGKKKKRKKKKGESRARHDQMTAGEPKISSGERVRESTVIPRSVSFGLKRISCERSRRVLRQSLKKLEGEKIDSEPRLMQVVVRILLSNRGSVSSLTA